MATAPDVAHGHVRRVWTDVLGVSVVPAPAGAGLEGEKYLTGRIAISGDRRMLVELSCHESAAWRATRIMFGTNVEVATVESSREELIDVVAELTNMTGGGVKALLTEQVSLELPVVTFGAAAPVEDGYLLAGEQPYLCGGDLVIVRIYEQRREA